MSTKAYVVGETVRLKFEMMSTATTAPESANVHLVVTSPIPKSTDTVFAKATLSTFLSTRGSTAPKVGACGFYKDFVPTAPGRWTYEFTSTGAITTRDGGAFAVARPLASTST